MRNLGFKVENSGFGNLGFRVRFEIWDLKFGNMGFRIKNLEFRVGIWDLRWEIQDLGSEIWDLGWGNLGWEFGIWNEEFRI